MATPEYLNEKLGKFKSHPTVELAKELAQLASKAGRTELSLCKFYYIFWLLKFHFGFSLLVKVNVSSFIYKRRSVAVVTSCLPATY